MATVFFEIGTSPHEEDCAIVGSDGYRERATGECQAFAGQLRRQCGPAPDGVKFQVKSSHHELGRYVELVVRYDDAAAGHVEFVRRVEAKTAGKWDDQALAELGRK